MIVTLYSKPGCHLCEDVREILDDLAVEHGFSVDEVNIEGDATLFAQYRYEIPVLAVAGREIARGRISEQDVVNALRGRGVL